uniref:Uncharacterized protein n=1 Tax=Oryzias latipes TaxID=8090 RepID=A0A3P9H188_ORYLA
RGEESITRGEGSCSQWEGSITRGEGSCSQWEGSITRGEGSITRGEGSCKPTKTRTSLKNLLLLSAPSVSEGLRSSKTQVYGQRHHLNSKI